MIRKISAYILMVCWIVTAFGCGTSHTDARDEKEVNVRAEDKNKVRNMQTDLIAEELDETILNNPYFFREDYVALTARANYFVDPLVEENIHLSMYKVHVYERGTVYKLETDHVGYLSEERWNIYFYVTEDKIYRFWPYVYQDGQYITFYDDDGLLVSILDTDEKLVENSVIVCQAENILVDEEDGGGRYRFRISKEDDLITYSRSDVQPNGERGFYEWFIWKEGEGLIEYGSGYKAETDFLYLYDIAIDTEKLFAEHSNKDKRRNRADVFIHGHQMTFAGRKQENNILL